MDTKTSEKKLMAPLALEGQTLGKYRILEPLGRGGMAQVFKAYHPNLDRYVAVKVLRSDLVDDPEFLARFQREARAVAGLRHPNIVQIYDFDVQNELYYMVMELLDGDTLKAHLGAYHARGSRLPYGDMLCIMNDVLSGLAYAHGEGIIHRDLKPANIILTRHGQAVLTDFGIAQIVGGTQYTVSGALLGTLNYMAPEQGLNGKSDARSDVYSMGITYYETLTGDVPFDADTPLAILMKHINDPLPLPRKLDPSIPEALERVALKALAKGPEDRYQSAAEMAEALVAAANEAGIELPSKIKLPQVENGSPASAVAVFSGAERKRISNAGFASGDTEATSGSRSGRLRFIRNAARFFTPPSQLASMERQNVRQAALLSVAALVIANLMMLWLSGIFGWQVFARTWPMELVMVGLLLSALMAALANYWMIIPVGIVMGNGFLLAYYSLTNLWENWTYFWPLEPLLVTLAIVAPFMLKGDEATKRWIARRVGAVLTGLAVIVFLFAMVLAVALPVNR